MKTFNFLNYKIFNDKLNNIVLSKKTVINTINPHSYCMLKNDKLFHKSLIESDVLLPDGIGIVLASRLLYGKSISKIAGYDIFTFLTIFNIYLFVYNFGDVFAYEFQLLKLFYTI